EPSLPLTLRNAPLDAKREFIDSETGFRVLVRRSDFCWCAYLGVRKDNPLADLDELNFDCHWGINFRKWGLPGSPWEEGWFWYGWDYGHAFDVTNFPGFSEEEMQEAFPELHARMKAIFEGMPRVPRKDWTLDEIFEDAMDQLLVLRTAVADAQKVASEIGKQSS
ncbi:hypothetical protein LC612_33045, partial [Nostoc sp. CHAB 5834]|nr:hypothetical protein [Nostoc sp. CHAB 5834]